MHIVYLEVIQGSTVREWGSTIGKGRMPANDSLMRKQLGLNPVGGPLRDYGTHLRIVLLRGREVEVLIYQLLPLVHYVYSGDINFLLLLVKPSLPFQSSSCRQIIT